MEEEQKVLDEALRVPKEVKKKVIEAAQVLRQEYENIGLTKNVQHPIQHISELTILRNMWQKLWQQFAGWTPAQWNVSLDPAAQNYLGRAHQNKAHLFFQILTSHGRPIGCRQW